MTNEIVILDEKRQITPTELFTPQGIDAMLEEVEKMAGSFVQDMTTEKGRKEIASMAYKIAQTKSALDKCGKDLTEEWRQKTSTVNAERKKVCDRLDALRDKTRKPLDDFEEREAKRINDRKERIAQIEAFKSLRVVSVDHFNEAIKKVAELLNYDWNEFNFKAFGVVKEATLYLGEEKEKVIKREQEKAELEKLRKEKEERDELERLRLVKENEERIARESAEKARKEAEEKALKEKQRAEQEAKYRENRLENEKKALQQEKIDTERKLKEAREKAIQEEKERAEEQRNKEMEEAVRREKNINHKKKIHGEIIEDLLNVKSEFQPTIDPVFYKAVIIAIAKGQIRNMSIKY